MPGKIKIPNFKAQMAAEAADFIASKLNTKTWIQHEEHRDDDTHCAIGWIRHVNQGLEDDLVEAMLCSNPVVEDYGDIETWNDEEDRNVEQVRAAFKRAAVWLRKQAKAGR